MIGIARRSIDALGTLAAGFLYSGISNPTPVITPLAWDAFAQWPTTTASGHPWLIMPGNGSVRVEPVIRNGAMTADDTGLKLTAAYPTLELERPPRSVRAIVSFANGADGGAATLILTRTLRRTSDIGHIVEDGSVHLSFSTRKVSVGLYRNRDMFTPKRIYYPRPLLRNGTQYTIGFDIDGEQLTVFAPGRTAVVFRHPRVAELAGRYVTFEPYWERGQCQVRFHRIEVA